LYVWSNFKSLKVGFCEEKMKTLNNSGFREMRFKVVKVLLTGFSMVFKGRLKKRSKMPENGQMSQPRISAFLNLRRVL